MFHDDGTSSFHHRYALFELGASAIGEIDHLASIVRPQISALLNARAAHLEGFGSLDGVIEGKGEIIDHTAIDGIVILNREEPAFQQWVERAGPRHIISVGKDALIAWSQELINESGCCMPTGRSTHPYRHSVST